MPVTSRTLIFFFFNDTATTEIYTLSLHDALPIFSVIAPYHIHAAQKKAANRDNAPAKPSQAAETDRDDLDRKSTRLNSSHQIISYAVFCLKKKKKNIGENTLITEDNATVHFCMHD